MARPLIAGRVTPEIKNKLLAHCQETGENESQVVAAAVAQYLGLNPPGRTKSIEQRLTAVERRLKRLMEL